MGNELDLCRFNFKKKFFGGVDEIDVLEKMQDLNNRYQILMENQKEFYEKEMAELKEKGGSTKVEYQAVPPINEEVIRNRVTAEYTIMMNNQKKYYENLISELKITNYNKIEDAKNDYAKAVSEEYNSMYQDKLNEQKEYYEKMIEKLKSDNTFKSEALTSVFRDEAITQKNFYEKKIEDIEKSKTEAINEAIRSTDEEFKDKKIEYCRRIKEELDDDYKDRLDEQKEYYEEIIENLQKKVERTEKKLEKVEKQVDKAEKKKEKEILKQAEKTSKKVAKSKTIALPEAKEDADVEIIPGKKTRKKKISLL